MDTKWNTRTKSARARCGFDVSGELLLLLPPPRRRSATLQMKLQFRFCFASVCLAAKITRNSLLTSDYPAENSRFRISFAAAARPRYSVLRAVEFHRGNRMKKNEVGQEHE